jgi:hypothetical protein
MLESRRILVLTLFAALVIAIVPVYTAKASETEIWEGTVSSDGTSVTSSVLLSGKIYHIYVEPGIMYLGLSTFCDAQYYITNPSDAWVWSSYSQVDSHSFLQINGQDVVWGPFSNGHPDYPPYLGHEYDTYYIGQGVPITLKITDWIDGIYDSNSCHLQVKIYESDQIQVGSDVSVILSPKLGLTFDQVTTAGLTTAAEYTVGPPPPPGQTLVGPYFDIRVTLGFSGHAVVRIVYDDSGLDSEGEASLRLLQIDIVPGDVNADGKVNLLDLCIIVKALGSCPGSPRWDPRCDLNGDNKITLKDLCIAVQHFGQTSVWTDITTYVDVANHIIYGETNHFSMFGVTRG